jgi:glycosyltransferase involved in cell wall biosynthesis
VVTVAIPIRDGRRWLADVLAAIEAQQVDHEIELLICDSGSRDGSRQLAIDAGARVIDLPPEDFDHARTRNLLVEEARGEFVAMLTQDAQPAAPEWLATLLAGFDVTDDVALVYGPYLPRDGCPPLEAGRLRSFFAALAPDGRPRIDRLSDAERSPGRPATAAQIGPDRGYFTDANGCIRRSAWQSIPYPPATYAEDHALAVAMLRGGWAKVFVPDAGVLHSHHYTPLQRLRRAFDDYRGLREVYGYRQPGGIGFLVLQLRGAGGVGARAARAAGAPVTGVAYSVMTAVAEQVLQLIGAALGSHAQRLSPGLRRRISLTGRDTVTPLDWDAIAPVAPPQRWT